MTRLDASEARKSFSEALNRVAFGNERITLARNGKDVAALIPLHDLQLLEELEDRMDVEAAKRALAESQERIPYTQVRRELGRKK